MPLLVATSGTHPSHDRRVDQDAPRTARAPGPQSPPLAPGAPVFLDVHAAVGHENAASAASDVNDLAAASALVTQLVGQLASQSPDATPAQRSPSPQAVLSLLR